MSVPGQQKTVRFDNLSVNGVGMARRKVAPYARLRGSTELAEVRSATPRRVGPQLLSGVALAERDAEAIWDHSQFNALSRWDDDSGWPLSLIRVIPGPLPACKEHQQEQTSYPAGQHRPAQPHPGLGQPDDDEHCHRGNNGNRHLPAHGPQTVTRLIDRDDADHRKDRHKALQLFL